MTNSNRAIGDRSDLDIISIEGSRYAIELSQMKEDDQVRWRWSIRLGTSISKGTSQSSFATREKAIQDAGIWWITMLKSSQ